MRRDCGMKLDLGYKKISPKPFLFCEILVRIKIGFQRIGIICINIFGKLKKYN